MKKKYLYCILLFIVGLFSCSSVSKNSNDIVSTQFKQFLKKFKPLQLPLTLRQDNISGIQELPQLDINSSDTLFLEKKSSTYYYGILPDTNNYYGIIILAPVTTWVPYLITYDKNGNKISEEFLLVRGCGAGVVYCSSTGIIKNDLTIYCADTIKTVKFDSKHTPIDSTRKYYCLHKEGKINRVGKVIFSDEKTKDLK